MSFSNPQTIEEEILNAVLHGIGACLGIVGLVILSILSAMHDNITAITSSAIYGASSICMYTASTLYHSIQQPKLKRFFKTIDHCAIYLMIAGTYTFFTLVAIKGAWGWTLFGVIWGLTLAGFVFKLLYTGRFERLSLAIYLIMGWMIVLAIKPLVNALSTTSLSWLVAGGLCYSIGTIFYMLDGKYKFFHGIWHLCVIAGSVCHFIAAINVWR